MYHNNINNQVFNLEKSLLNTHLSSKHSQFEEKILQVLRRFSRAPHIKIKNQSIADEVGCSVKTVTRITNKLQRDGLITKRQQNKFSPNHFTLKVNKKNGIYDYSQWVNSLSTKNQDLFVAHGIRVDHTNKIIFSLRNVPHNKSINLILDNLFINLSPSSRTRERDLRIFKKINDEKRGRTMNHYQNRSLPKEKPTQKRNTGGHSPVVLKPVLPLDAQIHAKKVDIAFFRVQVEQPETFWDPRSILFSVNVKMAASLLSKAQEELKDLEAKKKLNEESSDEKQDILYQDIPYSMAEGSA